MTKVAAPVVKMVEPLFTLIDFEEEIKVEKISKEECKTPEIELDYNYSDEEKKIEKNIIKKISKNKKCIVKGILNVVTSEINSNSNDSYLSENSNKSCKSDISQIKSVTPRRNPSRKICSKDGSAVKINFNQQNAKTENKSFVIKKTIKKINRTHKNSDLPLTCKDSNQNNITSTLEKEIIEGNSSNTLSHVPTSVEDIVSSTSEQNVNTDRENKNLDNLEQLENTNLNEINTQYKKHENRLKELEKTELEIEVIKNNCVITGAEQSEQISDVGKDTLIIPNENLNNISIKDEAQNQNNLPMEFDSENPTECESVQNQNIYIKKELVDLSSDLEICVNNNLSNYEIPKSVKKTDISLDIIFDSKTDIESKECISKTEQTNEKVSLENLEAESIPDEIEEKEQLLQIPSFELLDQKKEIQIKEEGDSKEHFPNTNFCENNSVTIENNFVKIAKKIENVLDTTKNQSIDLEEMYLNEIQVEATTKDPGPRFFIFDEEMEEENIACDINLKKEERISDQRICGEIIHRTQDGFSINCYMCWDDIKWAFKKFIDLNLFSVHLNAEHSDDEIHLQNQRGNSYSLDFVNQNSCVMPKPMWCGIYKEMFAFKCGIATIDCNGYIRYSCLECKNNFKSYNTFTKHILKRENKNEDLNIFKTEENVSKLKQSDLTHLNSVNTANCINTNQEKNDKDNENNKSENVEDNKIIQIDNIKNNQSCTEKNKSEYVEVKDIKIKDIENNCMDIENNKLKNIGNIKVSKIESIEFNNMDIKSENVEDIKDIKKENEINSGMNIVNNESEITENIPVIKIENENDEMDIENKSKNVEDIVVNKRIDIENNKSENFEDIAVIKTENVENNHMDVKSEKIEDITVTKTENVKNMEIETIEDIKISNSENKQNLEIDLNSKIEIRDTLPKSEGILESILKTGKEYKENFRDINNPLNVSSENIDIETKELNIVKTEEEDKDANSNTIATCNGKVEDNQNSDKIEEELFPDVYGYKKFTSTIFDIFDKEEDNSVSSKLNRILSLGQSFRDTKEKEKQDAEEKEKLKILSLSLQKDTRPRLEGVNILTKNILDIDDKLALLTCKYCDRRYTCLTNLREHFRVHIGDRMIICYECKRGFSKRRNLEEHIKIFHLESSDKYIDIDALGDNRKEIAKNTKITVNENNPKEKGFKCQYCPRFLSNRTVLEDHLRLHLGEKPLKCEKCDLEFLKRSIYDNHIIQVHELRESNNNLENFDGNLYDKENNKAFSNKMKLYNKSKFKCKQCPECFATKMELIEHLLSNHNYGEHKCRFCEQKFNSKKKRSYHEKLHKNVSKFKCSFCNQCFANLFSLEAHENSHKVNADFKCRFCDHYFASVNTRSLHEEMHQSPTKEDLKIQTVDIATILQMNNEQAPISSNGNANDSNGTSSDATDRSTNQNATSRNLMVKKIIKKIKRGKRDPNAPLDCRYCKKHFESPHQLSYHERLHAIGKKYQCNLCEKILASSYSLEIHLTAHLKKKTYLSNKFNGYTILTNQLALYGKYKPDFGRKIDIVSDVTLAPTQTMEILNNFFKRDVSAITVTTTSEDDSFQKIGVDDIEKNLAAHVLRDTDPYYQLMADFSYQYEMYQAQSVPKIENENFMKCSSSGMNNEEEYDLWEQRPKRARKKKNNLVKIESTTNSTEENDFKTQLPSTSLECQSQKLLPENLIQPMLSQDSNKKKEKKKISLDISKNISSEFIKCEYCNKKFNSSDKKLLSRHRRLHIAGDTHKCNFCNKCFATSYYLDKHLRVHHLNHVVELKCQSCESVYALKESLRRHEQRAHKDSNSINKIESNKSKDSLNDSNYNDNLSTQNNIEENSDAQDHQHKDQEFAVPEIPKKSRSKPKSKELKFECDFCEKAFPTLNTLQFHIDKIHKKNAENFEANYNIKCTYENCKKKFDCQTNYDRHLRLHESGFKCSICGKKTLSQILLDIHMRSHGLPCSFGCKYCKSRFTMELSKEVHERKVHFKGSIYVHPRLIIKKLKMTKRKVSYRCYNCKKSFSSLILLKAHTMYKHPVFECSTCPAMFSKINELGEHEKIHLKTLQCNLCDKTFENKHTLYKHRRQHETKFFKCNMCPAEFSFRDELNEHKKNHDESERPFKCVELDCDKAFIVETFLNTHLKKVHGYFLFNCDRCKREFLNEDLLVQHRKGHDVLPTDKQYRCDQCFKDFSTQTILRIHQKLHQSSVVAAAADSQTPDPQKTSKLKLYTCEQCDKRFSIVTYLNNHLKKVHQVKLFVCEHCKMEFRNEKDLQEHNKVHLTGKKFIRVEKTHLERPFKCELCGNSYAILAYLNNHLNKAHGNEDIKDESNSKEVQKPYTNLNINETSNNNENNKSSKPSNLDQTDLKSNSENSNENNQNALSQNAKKNNSIKCDHCYLRFISQKYLKDHSKMHLDPNDSARIEMLENAFNPPRSEKIVNPIISSTKANNNNNNTNQPQPKKSKAKKVIIQKKRKEKPKKQEQPKPKPKTYDEDSSSSVELIEVSEPPDIPEHNLSYTQITEALTSASSGLTAIQPVQVIESPNDDDHQMSTTELTPLTTLTSLTSLTPLTPLQPTAVFHHSSNASCNMLHSQLQPHLQTTNQPMELTSLEPSTISEATKLSLTLLEPSALCELTALTEPSAVPVHNTSLTDLTSAYGHSTTVLHHDHTVLTDLTSSSGSTSFASQLVTTQCNNSSTMLNTSSASSDYAVTNMDTSQITQQSKKRRISNSNMHLESFTMLDDNSSHTDHKSQSELTNLSTYDSTTQFSLTKTDKSMTFTDLSTKSMMSDSTSLEPLTYSDSMPLSEATTILELTSSSHPTSSSEATAFSESNAHVTPIQNSSGKKKRIGGNKPSSRIHKPNDRDIANLEGNFNTCSENNNFKCKLCRRIYVSWIRFRKHNEYHVLRPYQCPICPCNFKTNEEFFEHNQVHERSKHNFPCEICNRVFISKSRVKAHMLTVHNDEKEFKCNYCPSAFKTKSRLVDHVRCHTGEKPIKCHYCDEHFSRASYRLKHERATHPELLDIDIKQKEEKQREKKNCK